MSTMQFLQRASLLVAILVSGVQSAPLNATESMDFHHLVKRTANCGGNMYSNTVQQDGYGDLVANKQNGQTYTYTNAQGVTRTYPEEFGNSPSFSSANCAATDGPLFSQPVFSNGNAYMGGAPGADRAVVKQNSDGSYTQCWFMTHTGASTPNGFVLCT